MSAGPRALPQTTLGEAQMKKSGRFPSPWRTGPGLVVACLLVVWPWVAAAAVADPGLLLQYEVRDLRDDEAPLTSMSIRVAGKHLRMDGAYLGDQADTSLVFDASVDEAWCIDHRQKSYLVLDREAVEGMAGILRESMEELEKALEDVSEEERKLVQEMAAKRLPAEELELQTTSEINIEEGTERNTVAGYPSVEYQVTRDGRRLRQLWLTPWQSLENGAELAEEFGAVLDAAGLLLREITESGEEVLLAVDAAELVEPNPWLGMSDLEGIPVEITELRQGKAVRRLTLKSVGRVAIDEATFAAPEGYARREPRAGSAR